VISYEFCGFDKIKRLILLLNKIRFENKIKYLVVDLFWILESYVGDRVNKIRFIGSINKEIRFRKSVTRIRLLEKGNTHVKEKRRRECCDFF